jgi:hypothetical protein
MTTQSDQNLLAEVQAELQKRKTVRKSQANSLLLQNIYYLTKSLPESTPTRARIILLMQGLQEQPRCPKCGKELQWVATAYHWQKFCSTICSNLTHYGVAATMQRSEVRKKAEQTVQNRYGVKNVFESETFQKKGRATCKEKYGTEFPAQLETIQEKTRQTCRNHYGVSYVLQDKIVRQKIAATCLSRYGGPSPLHSAEIQAKCRATMQEKYGTENAQQVQAFREKAQATNMARRGVLYPGQSIPCREAIRKTCQQKYGVTSVLMLPEIQEKSRLRKRVPLQPHLDKLRSSDFWNQEYLVNQKSILQIAQELNLSDSTCGLYMHLYAPEIQIREVNWHSIEELRLKAWVTQQLPGAQVIQASLPEIARSLTGDSHGTPRFSLDIYIPSHKLAIEYNGLYWHSTDFHPDPYYHLKKTQACEALGIRLIHIWEDDWNLKRPLMESKLRHILGVATGTKVYPRQCVITVPTTQQKRDFYDAHHIKGDGAGFVTYALTHPVYGHLAMLTLKHTADPSVLDLNRFAVDTGFHVPGAFSKLLSHFLRSYTGSWSSIITYADRCWSQGNVYLKNGFTLTHETPPAFHGVERTALLKRVSRRAYTHERLARRFPEFYMQSGHPSQLDVLKQAGVKVVYDCGNFAFKLSNRFI